MQRPVLKFLVRTVALMLVVLGIAWGGGFAADHSPAIVSIGLFLLALSWLVFEETKA